MSLPPFPEHLDALKLFARQGTIEAVLPLSRLKRFSGYLHKPHGDVSILLHFGLDEEGRKQLTGMLAADVEMLCQRCLEAIAVKVESAISMLVLDEGQTASEASDAVYLDGAELELMKLLEDELIISLPLAPAHESADCSKELNRLRTLLQEDAGQKGNSPFAVLAALKKPDPADSGK